MNPQNGDALSALDEVGRFFCVFLLIFGIVLLTSVYIKRVNIEKWIKSIRPYGIFKVLKERLS